MDMVVIMCSWIKPSVYGFRSCLQKRTWPSTSFLPKVACPVPPYPISSTAPIRQWSCESSTKCARDLKLASMNFSALPFLMKQIWNHNTICIGYRPIGRYPFLVSRDSVAEDLRITYCVLPSAAAIGSVPLNSVDTSILALFYDTCVIRDTAPSQSKKIIIPGSGVIVLSAHWFLALNQCTPVLHPANFGMIVSR